MTTGTTDNDEGNDEEITLTEAIERSTPAQADAFERLQDALQEAPDHYDAKVKYEFCDGMSSVTIKSSHSWTNEGEVGTDRFHIWIGGRGGLNKAQYYEPFSGFEASYVEDYDVSHAWKRITERIRNAV